MTTLSIDAGTTAIKAVGYDDDGREHVVAKRATRVSRPAPGHSEQDMDEVWRAVCDAVREAVAGLPGAPAFLAVTAQGDGAWLVDDEGRPTGPAMLWNDGRAADQVSRWERDGVAEQARKVTGSPASTGMPHALLSWMHTHDRARLDRSRTLLTCGGWIFHQLTGERLVDESDAAAPFLDVRRRAWSGDLLDLYGVPWAERLLPELVGDDARVRPLGARAAADLGLPVGTPVVLAPYDICSTAIGSGAVEPADACCILGTTISTEIVLGDLDDDLHGLTVPLGVEGRWLQAFPTMAGGDVLVWMATLLGHADVAGLLALAARADGPGPVGFLPYLSPAGERHPFSDPAARGSLTGLSFDATPEQVAHAVLLGLTHTVRDCLESAGTRPETLTVSGGGSVDAGWRALVADVTGVPVTRPVDQEVGARGAHLVATVATGAEADMAAAVARHVVLDEPVQPDPDRSRHDEAYARFVALRDDLRPTWHRGDVR
jgi:xylulokinase